MQPKTPKFSVITVNYNSGLCLAELIASIKGLNISPDDLELIIIDNASSDGSLTKVEWGGLGKKIILNKENYGFSRANNQGIGLSSGKYIVLLNPDTRLKNNIFSLMEKTLSQDPSIGICGPRLNYPDGRHQLSCFSFPSVARNISLMLGITDFLVRHGGFVKMLAWLEFFLPKSAKVFLGNFRNADAPVEVPWVGGACMMIKKEVVENIGLLDERFFAYAEDEDFCLRARKAGYRIYYVPQAELVHHLGWERDSVKSRELLDIYFNSLKYLYTKHYKGVKKYSLIVLNRLGRMMAISRVNQ